MAQEPIALDPTGKAERVSRPALLLILLFGFLAVRVAVALDREIWPSVALELGAGIMLFSVLFVVERSFVRNQTRALLEAIDMDGRDMDAFVRTHSDEEVDRMGSPTGAVAVAFEWAEAMIRGDYKHAWFLSDPNWRRCRAQSWLWNNRALVEQLGGDRDALTDRILRAPDDDELWHNFVEVEKDQFRDAWRGIDLDQWGVASRSRPTGKNHELVILTPTGRFQQGYIVREQVMLPSTLNLLMHQTEDGWLLASHASVAPPTPGWPPSWWIIDDQAMSQGLSFGTEDTVRPRQARP